MQMEVGDRREVGSSSSLGVKMVGTSGEVAASSGVATCSQEEELDSDEAEEDAEIGGDIEEGEVQDLDAGSEDDNVQEGGDEQSEDETEVDQPEGTIEDNSSEPSTGARQVGRGLGWEVPALQFLWVKEGLNKIKGRQTAWYPPHLNCLCPGEMMGLQRL